VQLSKKGWLAIGRLPAVPDFLITSPDVISESLAVPSHRDLHHDHPFPLYLSWQRHFISASTCNNADIYVTFRFSLPTVVLPSMELITPIFRSDTAAYPKTVKETLQPPRT